MPIEFRLNVDNKDYMRTVSTRAIAMSKLFSNIKIKIPKYNFCIQKDQQHL